MVCPDSVHESGDVYKVVKDVPIAEVSLEHLKFVFRNYLITVQAIEKVKNDSDIDNQLNIMDVVDTSQLTLNSKGTEYFGEHPIHGSSQKSGINFFVNPSKNTWHCFRTTCDSGGGALQWIAVKEGIIDCSESQPGVLRKELFLKTLKVAQEKYGLKVTKKTKENNRIPEDLENYVENSDNINFEEYKKYFENTTKHICNYELINELFPLDGENYSSLKKACLYMINSILQPTFQIRIGKYRFDNRIHILMIAEPGKGKGVIKSGLTYYPKKALPGNIEVPVSISHEEQLLGKMVSGAKGKPPIERKGMLRNVLLVVDESTKVVNESDTKNENIMRLKRLGMDIYYMNEVSKNLVADEVPMSYFPTTRCVDFTHPERFSGRFFTTGTFRRYFAFEIEGSKEYIVADSTKGLFEEPKFSEQDIQQFLVDQSLNYKKLIDGKTFDPIKISKEGIKEAVKWIDAWNGFVLSHPNAQVQKFGERTFFSIKEYFFRLICIHGVTKMNVVHKEIPKEDVLDACFDCVELLLNTLETYLKNGNMIHGTDIWQTDDEQEATLLNYMFRKGATSYEKTPLSIRQVQEACADIMGLLGRRSISKYTSMKERGLIKDRKGQHDSKAWIGFTPNLATQKGDQEEGKNQKLPDMSELQSFRGTLNILLKEKKKALDYALYTNKDTLTNYNSDNSKTVLKKEDILDTPPKVYMSDNSEKKEETSTLTTLDSEDGKIDADVVDCSDTPVNKKDSGSR